MTHSICHGPISDSFVWLPSGCLIGCELTVEVPRATQDLSVLNR